MSFYSPQGPGCVSPSFLGEVQSPQSWLVLRAPLIPAQWRVMSPSVPLACRLGTAEQLLEVGLLLPPPGAPGVPSCPSWELDRCAMLSPGPPSPAQLATLSVCLSQAAVSFSFGLCYVGQSGEEVGPTEVEMMAPSRTRRRGQETPTTTCHSTELRGWPGCVRLREGACVCLGHESRLSARELTPSPHQSSPQPKPHEVRWGHTQPLAPGEMTTPSPKSSSVPTALPTLLGSPPKYTAQTQELESGSALEGT